MGTQKGSLTWGFGFLLKPGPCTPGPSTLLRRCVRPPRWAWSARTPRSRSRASFAHSLFSPYSLIVGSSPSWTTASTVPIVAGVHDDLERWTGLKFTGSERGTLLVITLNITIPNETRDIFSWTMPTHRVHVNYNLRHAYSSSDSERHITAWATARSSVCEVRKYF